MPHLDELIKRVRTDVDKSLDRLVPAADVQPRRLHEAIRWSLFAGGKRVRPVIVYAVGETFGATPDRLAASAAALEMVHTYSLIHDDLPSMDDDDLRRGRSTCHKQFDEATAILAGDVLQTLAFRAIADDEQLSDAERVRVISTLANESATPYGMVAGQQLDLDAEGKTLSIDEIEAIHSRKTGALISAAAEIGAVIGGAGMDETHAIKQYSERLGLLFQITDDLLDVTQGTESLGKTAGKDAASRKATYPGLLGVDGAREKASALLAESIVALKLIDRDTTILTDLARMVNTRVK